MTTNTEIELAKMSFADLKAVYDMADLFTAAIVRNKWTVLKQLVENEIQYRAMNLFEQDPLFNKYSEEFKVK